MIDIINHGVHYLNGALLCGSEQEQQQALAAAGVGDKGRDGTIAYSILRSHNQSKDNDALQIRFDALISHDITYVGIIQTARASGLTKFPIPYVLTNCHNSLCAVGGTINEDDHVFGLSAAKKYGGVYVPAMQAVIHQYAREMLAEGGSMILGSDSHTRYGALGTMAIGEGGPELVKQLLSRTYDVAMPQIVCVYLTGELRPGVGPQDVALALIGDVFPDGFVKNCVLEFVGPGVKHLSMDARIGIDVMTTETTCLSSIWETDEHTAAFYALHGRPDAYKELRPAKEVWYDKAIAIDLSQVVPMIAMPYHPSCVYPVNEVTAHPAEILAETEARARTAFGDALQIDLQSKVKDGKLYVDQAVIAGCAGGGFENITDAADILRGQNIGDGAFSLQVYPASMPIALALTENGVAADLMAAGAVIKPAFCGPCFGAGDTPANNAFSIRHTTRNFPNREGSKVQEGQVSHVALMDARSIAATAANGGVLTSAETFTGNYTRPVYHYDSRIYDTRIFDGRGKADPDANLILGPNIKDWPAMPALAKDLLLKVVSEIHDPVTTTDELIPSGETSSYRSNPLRLAEFALSRKDPAYVGRAKEVLAAAQAREAGAEEAAVVSSLPELQAVLAAFRADFPALALADCGIGSTIFAEKPGDGSAREQAASCQRVLGGAANIAREYATKRYRSNLINWGMLPLLIEEETLPFANGDWIYLPDVLAQIESGKAQLTAYALHEGRTAVFSLSTGTLTEDEREIIKEGCLINYYRANQQA